MGRRKDDRVVLGEIIATPMASRGTKDGKRYWRARGPSPERLTLWTGWGTFEEIENVVSDLHRKGVPAASRSARADGVRTVANLLDRWEAHQKKRHEGAQIAAATIANYTRACRSWGEAIGDVTVRSLSREIVEDTLTAWVAEGVGVRTAKGYLDALAACVTWGAARGLCEAVPLARMSVLTIRDDEFVGVSATPTQPQVAAVIRQLDGWYRDLITLQVLTGARVGEIAALHVRDWDRAAGTLTLSGRDDTREKRGKVRPRRFPVLGELGRVLASLAADRGADDRLVPITARRYAGQLSRHLTAACIAAQVPVFTTHGIRRLVVEELLERENARRVAELTGHSVVVLLRRYVRPTTEQLRDVVARAGLTATEPRGTVHQLRVQNRGTGPDSDG